LIQETAPIVVDEDGCTLLYAPEWLDNPHANFLCGDIFKQALSSEQITLSGRGQAWFIEMPDQSMVLRSYQRGGLISKFNQQTYIGWSAENSRAYKEWRLLLHLTQLGLPVPRPIAASFCRWPFRFIPLYRAHILLQRIPNVQTLDHLLAKSTVGAEVWKRVGACIRQFHDQGVYHADLNANNILLDSQQTVYLIDFDKSEIRQDKQSVSPQKTQWKLDNLQRLKRSLLKQQGLHEGYNFNELNWNALMAAYE